MPELDDDQFQPKPAPVRPPTLLQISPTSRKTRAPSCSRLRPFRDPRQGCWHDFGCGRTRSLGEPAARVGKAPCRGLTAA